MRVHFTVWLIPVLMFLVACTPITPSPSPVVQVPPTPTAPSTATALPPPTATATPAPVRLVLWENLPPGQASALTADVRAFETTRAYYTIDIQHYGDPQAFIRAVQDETVDVHLALGDAFLLSALQARDDIQPVDDLFDRGFLADFVSPAMTGATRAGHLWGLPDTTGLHLLLFYNRDLIAVPPANTEELYTVAQSFTQEGRWGLAMNSYDPLWVVPWLWAYGGWLCDSDGNPTLDIPPMVKALTLYLGWHGRLTGVAPVGTYMEARQLFLSGEAAMLIDGEWAIGELGQTGGVNWGVAPLPAVGETGQPAAPLVAGRYWMIKSNLSEPERDAAKEFMAFMTTPERQLYWTSQFGVLPTRVEALKDPAILADPYLRVSAQQMQSGRGLPLGVDANQILDAMRAPLRAVLDGDMAPDEAARAMQAALE